MKKKTTVFLILILALGVFLSGCVKEFSAKTTASDYIDGRHPPALDPAKIESVVIWHHPYVTGNLLQERLTEEEIGVFVRLYNDATVKWAVGETTPDFGVVVKMRDGATLKMTDDEDDLDLGGGLKIVNGELYGFLSEYFSSRH